MTPRTTQFGSNEARNWSFVGFGDLPIAGLLSAHPTLVSAVSIFDPVYTAGIFGGLLTVPELQCNCCRLEAISHIAVAYAQGKKKPSKSAIATWFSEMSSGPCGRLEDPAEDAFVSLVTTPRGNFRILKGIWESAGFFLQRIMNVVEGMPKGGEWDVLRESVYSLLSLSELICNRADLPRYRFGNPIPEPHLSRAITAELQKYRQRVTFSDADVRAYGIALENLTPFILEPELWMSIPNASLSHSPLLYHPLLRRNGQLIVALPTAISIAIRVMVISNMIKVGLKDDFLKAVGREYRQFFKVNPPLGTKRDAPFFWRSAKNTVTSSFAQEVDSGRYLQLIFVLDTLKGFEESALAGSNPDALTLDADLDAEVDRCRAALLERPNFREGLTLVVGCGIGRTEVHISSGPKWDDWRIVHASSADISTLSMLGRVTSQTLWRILDAKRHLARLGVELFNINGLLNLYSWVRSLDGHIVQHAQMPEGFGSGGPCLLMIPQQMVRDIRMEVAKQVDLHAVQTMDGEWRNVRKVADSFFAEDRALPIYASSEWISDRGLPMVFLTSDRSWWCEVTHPTTFDRWKIMLTWLPKIATILNRELTGLPNGALSLLVRFGGYRDELQNAQAVSEAEIRDRIAVRVDKEKRLIEIETDEAFEHGLVNPVNISEAALVGAIVSGFISLASEADDSRAAVLQGLIVRDCHCRSSHGIHASHFRDHVRADLPDVPVLSDPIDDGTLRLGLGWKAQNQDDGSIIEGKTACTAFLNGLVKLIEEELCSELRTFNRRSLIEMALKNHEAAMINRAMWSRTSAAILALHDDKSSAMTTIAEQAFKNNAALLASRVLVELAVCECPTEAGIIPGEMDLSWLMARLLLVIGLGGWSDAIHLGAMTPSLRITPLGDVHADPSFFDDVVKPFGNVTSDHTTRSSVSRYDSNFVEPTTVPTAEPAFDPEFVTAWKDEHGFGLDDFRRAVDEIEDFGIKNNRAVFTIRRSELRALVKAAVPDAGGILEVLTTTPRKNWQTRVDGFDEKDRYPWRFRRQLSLLRRPIVQVDESVDPSLIVAPGLLRDAMVMSVQGYHDGSFPLAQLKTRAMKSWWGTSVDRRGAKFNEDVTTRMAELGWKAEPEVPVTRILRMGFDLDYGDVDVLAWNEATGRILFLECKDLHFHKTPGELAEQLSDFCGRTHNGKRDLLKKHIDRCSILAAHTDRVASYMKFQDTPTLESWLVFRNPVPMLFASKELENTVRITIYDRLDEI